MLDPDSTPDPDRAEQVLNRFTPATRRWFTGAFSSATEAQLGAWEATSRGDHTLVIAPTGSGKTLAAFLWALDGFLRTSASDRTEASGKADARGTTVLYISPLKALGVDVQRNLRAPLIGITQTAAGLGVEAPEVRVGVRTGDTPARDRRRLVTDPPDILITTPESLYLMLTSKARNTLASVHTVIIDEVHALADSKRGAHLAVSLERLDELTDTPAQRIGLSATVSPPEEVARFIGGVQPVTIVNPASAKRWDLHVSVPVDDMTRLPDFIGEQPHDPAGNATADPGSAVADPQPVSSIWPHIEHQIIDRVSQVHSTIIFTNSRRLAERLTQDLNEMWATRAEADQRTGEEEFARSHHGSVSKVQRALVEEGLKAGTLRCVVATSSLELGIDMGSVDLVIQVEAAPSVASCLQRVGRAGHQVGEISHGVFYPKHRSDLVNTAVITERMLQGKIEQLHVPDNPLDILAQQTIAAVAMDDLEVEAWYDTVRRAAPFTTLGHQVYESVLDLISGRYPSDDFAELRPRVLWDRDAGTLSARPGAQRLAVTSGGTIPDRGLFGVFLADGTKDTQRAEDIQESDPSQRADSVTQRSTSSSGGRRVGELDEEMVYESRVGDVIVLGTTSWKIQEITHDRVLVLPAFGQPGKLPFWRGESEARPTELGAALGAFRREIGQYLVGSSAGSSGPSGRSGRADSATAGHLAGPDDPIAQRLTAAGLDERAQANLVAYLSEQQQATGVLPTDQTLVIERFRDELGDWRVVLHSGFGHGVHGPWALAVAARLTEQYGFDAQVQSSNDGIVLRLPMMETAPQLADLFLFDPDELADLVRTEVGSSALFASRFRENAARALLIPRTKPGQRAPLWQQRQRAAQLLGVAAEHPQFPIILETVRECLQDFYDMDGLMWLMRSLQSGSVRLVEVETATGSPFAQHLLFGYTAQFLYETDSPLAERRAAALSLDPELLRQLFGDDQLQDLLDDEVIAEIEADLQYLSPRRQLRWDTESVADLVRVLGPLDADQLAARMRPDDAEPATESAAEPAAKLAKALAEDLVHQRRAIRVRMAGRQVYVAIEDAARIRDGLGIPLPMGIPVAFIEPVDDPLGDLLGRYLRTHTVVTAEHIATHFGLGTAVVTQYLADQVQRRRVASGIFQQSAQSGGVHTRQTQYCQTQVLRRIRQRSLAVLRQAVEPVTGPDYARFVLDTHGIVPPRTQHGLYRPGQRGIDAVAETLTQLAGYPAPASAWEHYILPARVADYAPGMLNELLGTGEFVMAGTAPGTGDDGWLAFHPVETAELTVPIPDPAQIEAFGRVHHRIIEVLADAGAFFFPELCHRVAGLDGDQQSAQPDSQQAGQQFSDSAVLSALWDLFWAGVVTNDSFTMIRAGLATGRSAHRQRSQPRRSRARRARPRLSTGLDSGGLRPSGVRSTGVRSSAGLDAATDQPRAAGRFSLLRHPEATGPDSTLAANAQAEVLLDRYGVITRGAVSTEKIPGGFGYYYRFLTHLEEIGALRRGYFIDQLGAAQFATANTVDALRSFHPAPGEDDPDHPRATHHAVGLAATDPANPYGATLPWPEIAEPATDHPATGKSSGPHRPGRKAGALVVLLDGQLAVYLERGGKTILEFPAAATHRPLIAQALVEALQRAGAAAVHVKTVNGSPIRNTELAEALLSAGFSSSPQGVRFHPHV
ncbi:ATP-dependent helicase [Auritidibacter ignavus]|uniref:ATP-dependent helicase n=1 Tax=Auritidibacter TaxID=1160973 RepID=UPI001E604303|nr:MULTISPECIES: ATP-dependent helicase [Auritidibacter]WGH80647.1 ATP-dependent helicase [Auritidibacter ignavus]